MSTTFERSGLTLSGQLYEQFTQFSTIYKTEYNIPMRKISLIEHRDMVIYKIPHIDVIPKGSSEWKILYSLRC